MLQVRNLSKAFPGVKALENVSVDFETGRVHAVTGENGAGKSTLMKILAGLLRPDAGEIVFRGRPLHLRGAHDALRAGIAMIHQELMPFPDLTIAENICMGREPVRPFPGWLDKPAMRREAARLLERLGAPLSPARRMKGLSVAEMQTVEIAKALGYDASVIIMDEPTSALSEREVRALFGIIGDLKERGVAVIYISHKMDEIFRLADTVTVLRDGRHVATRPAAEFDEPALIAMMVGRAVSPARAPAGGSARGAPALEVRGLGRRGKFRDVSFSVAGGEILGVAGLVGAGRTELVSAIAGMAAADSGETRVHGRAVRISHPADAIAAGISMVTEDRQEYGLIPRMAVKHNITLASLHRCGRGPFLDHAAEHELAERQIRALGIRTPDSGREVRYLSGGNQQKVLLARALLAGPAILILDEPTRGIDIGAKAEIYAIARGLAAQGKAIIMVSSDLPEIMTLSDRILVMREGVVTAELHPVDTTQEEILRYAMPA